MTKFQITFDVEMRKLFEQPPESASPFTEVPQFWKDQPESASPFPYSAGVLKNS
jgi:hypothetical protein